jgi:hypothetical protein
MLRGCFEILVVSEVHARREVAAVAPSGAACDPRPRTRVGKPSVGNGAACSAVPRAMSGRLEHGLQLLAASEMDTVCAKLCPAVMVTYARRRTGKRGKAFDGERFPKTSFSVAVCAVKLTKEAAFNDLSLIHDSSR